MTDADATPDLPDPGRSLELSIEVPGTPEEVWEAIATGPGISSWYVPMEVEERAGGEVTMDWGDLGHETADVVVWDPPHRVVFAGRGDRALAYEWLVEAREGGTCIVRLVNSGFGEGEDWDEQYHGMAGGWTIFLESLRLKLAHFPGRPARAWIPTVMVAGPHAAAWARACREMGIDPDADVGDHLATGEGVPPLAGRIESVLRTASTTAYLLLLDAPTPGTAFLALEGAGDVVALSAYLFLYDPDDGTSDPSTGEGWKAWLAERFPPPPPNR